MADEVKAESIKVTNGEALELLGNAIWANRQLPVKTRYWLSRIADKLRGIGTAANNERMKIIHELCAKDEAGKPITSGNRYVYDPPEKQAAADKAINELYDVENWLPCPRQVVDLSSLGDKFELSAADMASAAPIVEFIYKDPAPAPAEKNACEK